MPKPKQSRPVLPDKGNHTTNEDLRQAQENVVNGIENSDINLVKKYIKIAGPSLDTQALIRLNIVKTNEHKQEEHLKILKLILEDNKIRKTPNEIDCLEDALSYKKIDHFKIIANEMKSMGYKEADIGPAIDKIVSRGEKELFQLVVASGFYSNKWATANLVTAYLGDGKEIAKPLIELGADPTLDGSHQILKALDSRMQKYPSQDAEEKLLSLISFYKLEDILSIPNNLKKELQEVTKKGLNEKKRIFGKKILEKTMEISHKILEL